MWIHPLRYLTLLKYYILDVNSPATVRYLTLLKYYTLDANSPATVRYLTLLKYCILDVNSPATLPHTAKILHPWCEFTRYVTSHY